LGLIDINNYHLAGEVLSPDGIASTFDGWIDRKKTQDVTRDHFFRNQLKKKVDILSANLSTNLDHIPILISGMASSSIGMKEVPYATLPFALNGSGASIKCFDVQDDFPHNVMLISGVKTDKDVMRGEETQLIGLLELMTLEGKDFKDAVFIFPGTHSKHISVDDGEIISFKTYMTGEVFNLMVTQSILKDSVTPSDYTDFTDDELDAFKMGLNEASSSNILHSLFQVRTNQLFDKLNKKENFIYLSGLLIGTELKSLLDNNHSQLVLCSGSNLHVFYKRAIEEMKLSYRSIIIPADIIDKSAFYGQIKIFQNQQIALKNIAG
jgi:2-dehydro-3-deoxygalactonokinase